MIAELYWAANTEEDLDHYNVYYGTQSGVYSAFRVEQDTQHFLSGLADGIPYFFAITAVDSAGNESGFSDEVTKTNKRIKKLRIA